MLRRMQMIIEQLEVGPMAVFCYIVGCEHEKECVLIDPAGSEEKVLAKVDELGFTVKYVINTHAHADHTCGNHKIMARTGARLVVHEEDAADVAGFMNKAFSMGLGKRPSPKPELVVRDGDVISFGRTALKVIHTPGHTRGSICLYGEGNLFTGDTLFVGAVGRTDLKGGSLDVLLDSLRKLIELPPETKVWPGHDYGDTPTSTIAKEKSTNPYITDFILD